MKHIKFFILVSIYLLSSSIFFHAQAMNIVTVHDMDCTMHEQQETTNQAESNCYETCLGAYDEISGYSAIGDLGAAICLSQYYDLSVSPIEEVVFDSALYRHLIDDGGGEDSFTDTYISITKKLE